MGCCHKACGDGTLHSATCYMNTHTMRFVEQCVCKFEGLDNNVATGNFGKCRAFKHTNWAKNHALDADGVRVGVTLCKWKDSDAYNIVNEADSGLDCRQVNQTCSEKIKCKASDLCSSNFMNKGMSLFFMTLAGSLVISLGVVPLCVSILAEMKGMKEFSQACCAIGCCSSSLVTGCGGGILVYLPLVLSLGILQNCVSIVRTAEDLIDQCKAEGLSECAEITALTVKNLCETGESWFVASSFQIAALVLNMFALAVITFRFFRTAYARRLTQVKYQGEQMANIVV